MRPGVTIFPLAEITLRDPSAGISGAICRIFPSFTATSSNACKFWLGSMTVPPLISKSRLCDKAAPISCGAESVTAPATRAKLLEVSKDDPPSNLENWRRVSTQHLVDQSVRLNVMPLQSIQFLFARRAVEPLRP